jgi:outer membrane protein W
MSRADDAAADRSRDRFYFRAGPLWLTPMERSEELVLSNVAGPASLAVDNGPIAGSGASVSGAMIPAVQVGFVLPWLDRRLSVETVLGTPFEIEFVAEGSLATESIAPEAMGIPTGVPPLGSELGRIKAVAPVVTAVYRFVNPTRFTPYAGGGLTLLMGYGGEITNPTLTEVGEPDFEVNRDLGYVVQGGLESRIFGRFFVTADVKFAAFLSARGVARNVHVRAPALPLYDTVEVGTATMDVQVNPLVLQLGAGLNF